MKYKLGDICEIVSGSTPKSNAEEYWDGDVKWITPAELNDDSYIVDDSVRKITRIGVAKTGLKSFPAGTVILSSRAPIGKVAIAGCEMYCNQGFKNLICSDRINNKYLFWFLKGNTAYLNSLGRGATFKEISKQIVGNIEIDIPSMSEQLRAVEQFEKVRNIMLLRQQQLAELDTLVKARFVEMFGNPVVNDKGWKQQPMNTVAPADTAKEIGGMVWLLNLDMIEAQTGRIIDYLFVDSSEIGTSTCAFDTGNVLYSKLRPYLNKVVVPEREGFCTTELVPLRPCRDLDRQFLAYLLRSDAFVSFINEKVAGAKMPRVSMGVFREFLCIMPPIEMQKQFSTFVSQVDKSKFVYAINFRWEIFTLF